MTLFADRGFTVSDFFSFVQSVFSSALSFLLDIRFFDVALGAFVAGCVILGFVLRRFMYH